jgi:DMSO/TMAO reductase YedYZ molybdopterin-dependent catalytic subunit
VLFFIVFLALSAGAGAAAGSGPEESRRSFLRSTALGFGAVTVASSGLLRGLGGNLGGSGTAHAAGSTSSLVAPAAQEDPLLQAIASGVPGLSPEITPNDKFYTVSKNVFRDPSVNERDWRLDVGGLVERPFALTYEELLGMPSSTQYFTLQCISNDIGGDLIGNALWRGVSLGDLLRRAGVRDGAVDVVLRSADDYHDSIPIAKAWQSDAMVAYEMNGVRLPQNHGFPARLLVPDIYGMKNVKWLTKIEVVDYDYQGYWMVRGWSDVATMNTTSRIDVPKNGSSLRSGRNYVGGVAVAGQRGIQAVEVSTDGGATWAPAAVKPGLGPNAWVLWLYEWSLPEPGAETRVLVRATDGNGMLQDGTVRGSLPDGATGYHTITIRRG